MRQTEERGHRQVGRLVLRDVAQTGGYDGPTAAHAPRDHI